GEDRLRDFFLVLGRVEILPRDLDAIVPAPRLIGVQLRMIDAVDEDVAKRVLPLEDRYLVLAEQIPPPVDEAIPHAVDPLHFVALDARLRHLRRRRAENTKPKKGQRQERASDFLRSKHRDSPQMVR